MKRIVAMLMLLNLLFTVALATASCGNERKQKPSELNYELIEGTQEYRVLSVIEIEGGALVIPSEYNGLPVTEIGAGAFAKENGIVTAYIPDSVVVIGARAFEDCRTLEELRLPEYLAVIPARMTSNTKITSLTIPERVKRIETRAFCTCSVKELVIPDSVEYIGYEAFYASALQDVTIGASIQNIQPYAFHYCDSLKRVTFKNPDNITLQGVTFREGFLNVPENLPPYFLDEMYACRIWSAKK